MYRTFVGRTPLLAGSSFPGVTAPGALVCSCSFPSSANRRTSFLSPCLPRLVCVQRLQTEFQRVKPHITVMDTPDAADEFYPASSTRHADCSMTHAARRSRPSRRCCCCALRSPVVFPSSSFETVFLLISRVAHLPFSSPLRPLQTPVGAARVGVASFLHVRASNAMVPVVTSFYAHAVVPAPSKKKKKKGKTSKTARREPREKKPVCTRICAHGCVPCNEARSRGLPACLTARAWSRSRTAWVLGLR